MKRLFLATCLVLGSFSAHAATEENKQVGLISVNNAGLIGFQVKNATSSAHPACAFGLLIIRDTRATPSFPTDTTMYQASYSAVLAAQKAGTTLTVDFTPQADGLCRVNLINFN